MNKETRKKIEEYVKSMEWTPKDFYWKHALQVRNFALIIQEKVGGDEDVVEASALLHDVGKAKLLGSGHEEISAELAQEFLKELNFNDNKIKQIAKCVKYENFDSVEAKILRSADSMALIMDKPGRRWYFENVLNNNKEKILEEIKKSYSEIKFEFARDMVEDTYKKLIEKYEQYK